MMDYKGIVVYFKVLSRFLHKQKKAKKSQSQDSFSLEQNLG
jgi:hypothetical protein